MNQKIEKTSGNKPPILLTGATGYVGGRLLQRLEEDGRYRIRCLARKPGNVRPKELGCIEVVKGDLLDPNSLSQALSGVDTAYFLVHALGSHSDFEKLEEEGANNFAQAAKSAGIKKIVYLGGLGESADLSPHLRSRQIVGSILRDSGVPTIEFRASIIIGSGSLSFELIRSLTEKLPIMITPRWVYSKAQPIAIRNVLDYLMAALDYSCTAGQIFEIGGMDQVTYGELIQEYARQRGLKRLMLPVPVLTPRLSSLWLGLVTPVFARVGRKLVDGLKNDTIVTNGKAQEVFSVKLMGYAEAITRAISKEDQKMAETYWYSAISSGGSNKNWGGVRFGNRILDVKMKEVAIPPERLFKPIREIGGARGWYYADFIWSLRGWLDLIIGGVGMRRGRAHPEKLNVGDAIDCWRVEAFEPDKLLRLKAEMKLPGRAWLQFEVTSKESISVLTQTAIFDPLGLLGLLYWYALYPVHTLIFQNMLIRICKRAGMGKIEHKIAI
ncbi:SDR family oxidoreductase [Oligoflexia bacterium]|nr:SDR family oxidoreductase [Oligoflexia bacterium]